MQLPLTLVRDGLLIGRHTVISFNRTLRIPEDGKSYDLPAGFGRLPILRVEDVADRVPEKWRQEGGLIVPLYQREALFLEFSGADWRPTIAKVAVGGINAINGEISDLQIKAGRQDYIVIPAQRWLDGINSGDGIVKQFIAMPLGEGYTVEAQVTDEEAKGGFQFVVYDPKNGLFSEPKEMGPCYDPKIASVAFSKRPVAPRGDWKRTPFSFKDIDGDLKEECIEMGIAAGGSIQQQIVEDEYGANTWDPDCNICFQIHIVNSAVYQELTGRPVPPTPITAEAYVKARLPWFKHYDETRRTVSVPTAFKKLLSVVQIDRARGHLAERPKKPALAFVKAVPVKTESLHERINSLLMQARSAHGAGSFQESMLNARMCAELADRHQSEISPSDGSDLSSFIAECYLLAGESATRVGQYDEAEEMASRSLTSLFTESALILRLRARIQSKKFENARYDCDELLRRNPDNEYANWAHSMLPAVDSFEDTSVTLNNDLFLKPENR